MNPRFEACLKLAEQSYGVIDREVAAIIVATVCSAETEGDPIWLVIIGPPSSGKSEHLLAFAPDPFINSVTTLTRFALVPKQGEGVLKQSVGKCLVISDFSALLGMHPVEQREVFGILRNAFDGKVSKAFSGKTVEVVGKFALVAACTEALESHRHAISELGERFLYVRKHSPSVKELRWLTPIELKITRETIQHQVIEVIAEVKESLGLLDIPRCETTLDRLDLIARARTGIIRNSYSKNVELTPEPEGAMRMYAQVMKLKYILRKLGAESAILRIYRGSVPLKRVLFVKHWREGIGIKDLASIMKVGSTTVQETKIDLQLLGFVAKSKKIELTDSGRGLRELLGFS